MKAVHLVLLTAFVLQPLRLADAQEKPSDKQRAQQLRYLQLVFSPSVFSDDKFPECDFLEPDRAKELLGDYSIETEFYDADQNRVDRPSATGRYGAVVTVAGSNGFELTRYRTLYRAPKQLSWWTPPVGGSVTLPSELGIAPDVARGQSQQIITSLLVIAARDMQRSHDTAVLLAGLSETTADRPPASRYSDAQAKDRAWWLRLSRKLNGNAQRFTAGPPLPTTIEGPPARVLRRGTPREAGMRDDTAERIDAVLSKWAADTDEPFIACVARHGVIVFHKAYGQRDGKPVSTDTKNAVASITKAMSGSLMMMFVDRGLVNLDDAVEKFLPEFAAVDVDKNATMHHLFTHTAGMESHTGDGKVDLEHIYGGKTYALLDVGARHEYNGDSLGIGTRVLEQISGRTLPQLYKACLFDPLGCESIEATNSSWDGRSTALDLARIGQLLVNRGAYGDKRFFSAETFQQMIPRPLTKLLGDDTQRQWGIGLTWFRDAGLSDQVIGHGSATSCTLRVDLKNDLVITMSRGARGRNFDKYHPQFTRVVAESIAELPVADPEVVGMSREKLALVKPALQQMVDDKKIPGAIVIAARHGKTVLFETAGWRDSEAGEPMAPDSILRFYSMTKPITSVAIMRLVEQGRIGLDDPVSKHVPEFHGLMVFDGPDGDELKLADLEREPTIRDLLRHTSGLTYGFFGESPVDRKYLAASVLGPGSTLQDMVRILGQLPLLYQPGTRFNYSVSTDVLGHIVERTSSQRLDHYFQQHIFDPLDMHDTAFFVADEKAVRLANNYGPKPDGDGLRVIDAAAESRYRKPPKLYSGGGGLVSTARDYMRFCQMLLNKGELNGRRLLKSETIEQMTRNQLPESAYPIALGEQREGVGFGFGFSVVVEKTEYTRASRVGEYGWGGAASTHFWISPADDLAVIALTQYMPYSSQLEDAVKPLVYEAIVE